jgi:hypothetical protein
MRYIYYVKEGYVGGSLSDWQKKEGRKRSSIENIEESDFEE